MTLEKKDTVIGACVRETQGANGAGGKGREFPTAKKRERGQCQDAQDREKRRQKLRTDGKRTQAADSD